MFIITFSGLGLEVIDGKYLKIIEVDDVHIHDTHKLVDAWKWNEELCKHELVFTVPFCAVRHIIRKELYNELVNEAKTLGEL